ncbi:MAG TPA: metal-dependent hydrolase [Gemmatimonadaceae bacterium]
MPTPVGHVLGGVAAGWLLVPDAGRREVGSWRTAALLGFAGAAADLDLLTAAHRGPTHSLGAAVLAGLAAWVVARALTREGPARWGLAIAVAWASHVLLDALGTDTSPPLGVPAFWPVSDRWHESGLHVFGAISRRYWRREFWIGNTLAVLRELLVLAPLVWLVIRVSTRASAAFQSRSCPPHEAGPPPR